MAQAKFQMQFVWFEILETIQYDKSWLIRVKIVLIYACRSLVAFVILKIVFMNTFILFINSWVW